MGVRVVLEMSAEDAEWLIEAVKAGKFAGLGVIDVLPPTPAEDAAPKRWGETVTRRGDRDQGDDVPPRV